MRTFWGFLLAWNFRFRSSFGWGWRAGPEKDPLVMKDGGAGAHQHLRAASAACPRAVDAQGGDLFSRGPRRMGLPCLLILPGLR